LVGCRLLSGLSMQSRRRLLALMVSANWVRTENQAVTALDIRWVIPIPGLTGSPSSRFALTTPEAGFRRYSVLLLRRQRRHIAFR